jgi:hypothetical protein
MEIVSPVKKYSGWYPHCDEDFEKGQYIRIYFMEYSAKEEFAIREGYVLDPFAKKKVGKGLESIALKLKVCKIGTKKFDRKPRIKKAVREFSRLYLYSGIVKAEKN